MGKDIHGHPLHCISLSRSRDSRGESRPSLEYSAVDFGGGKKNGYNKDEGIKSSEIIIDRAVRRTDK